MNNDLYFHRTPAERDWAAEEQPTPAVPAEPMPEDTSSAEKPAAERIPPRPYPEEPAIPPRPYPEEPAIPPRPYPEEPAIPPRPYPEEPAFPPLPIFPDAVAPSEVRFLNAAFGYPPLRILVGRRRAANHLGYGSVSGYMRFPSGYQTVTVASVGGYMYLQKTVPLPFGSHSTIAVIQSPGGLELLQIPDCRCRTPYGFGELRVSNLAFGSGAVDTLLADGRVIFGDVQYKETTSFKKARPGGYQLFFANTAMTPMPIYEDIETVEDGFDGTWPASQIEASLFLSVAMGERETVVLLNAPGGGLQTVVISDRS